MRILIGADFAPTTTNEKLFIEADCEKLFGDELLRVLSDADYRIFNLETPLIDKITPIDKYGPALATNKEAINLYKKLNVSLLILANNHIMDQGKTGLDVTQNTLKENGIAYTGCGKNLNEAKRPHIFNCNDGKLVGVYACAEHEFSIADTELHGANPFEPLVSYDEVHDLKTKVDYVIVLYHGGNELYRYPSPNLQLSCRKFVDCGADLVICQHSHCIGCEEKYKNKTIVYGQGNFLFGKAKHLETKTGLLLDINDYAVNYIPIMRVEDGIRIACGNNADEILSDFRERSEAIMSREFVEEKYYAFSQNKLSNYLWAISGANSSVLLRLLNRITKYEFSKWYVKRRYKKEQLLMLKNHLNCESHREAILYALKKI